MSEDLKPSMSLLIAYARRLRSPVRATTHIVRGGEHQTLSDLDCVAE
eukprot:gene5414-6266_t